MSASLSPSTPMMHEAAENEVQQMKLLAAMNDEHEGVIVELSEPMGSEVFASMLKASIAYWRKQVKFSSYFNCLVPVDS